MLHKLCVILAVILVVGAVAAPAVAGDDYTFIATNGTWDDFNDWDPNDGPPDEFDTATIPNDKTCTVNDARAAKILTIEDGGTVVQASTLTLGEQLTTDVSTMVIEDGGSLEATALNLYGDITIDGDTAIVFSGTTTSTLFADVTIDGSGTVNGVCGTGPQFGKGTIVRHNGFDLTISSGVTLKNIGSNEGVGDNVNNGIFEVSCGGTNLVEVLNGGQNYGTGLWHMKSGEMKTDHDVTEWTTPGSAGTFKIEGGTWHFEGTCIDFSDTLIFKHGTFKYRTGHIGVSFENTGNFTFGGDATNDMVFEITEDNSFEVGN